MIEVFDWLKPSPLWQADGGDVGEADYAFFRPRLLCYQTDDFVDAFLAAVAAPQPTALASALAAPAAVGQDLKLFQPTHGCFYLVCATLSCRIPSFPDRQLDTAERENTFFVLRKLVGGAEYGWLPDGAQKGWQPLNGQARGLLAGEQRLPLAPAPTAAGRAVWFGYLPAASAETYNVPPATLATAGSSPDPRVSELRARFVDVVKNLPTAADLAHTNPPPNVTRTMSVYLLLDLWEFLAEPAVLPDVAAALRDNPTATFPNASAKAALMTFLRGQVLGGSLTLAEALHQVALKRPALNQPAADPTTLGFGADFDLAGKTLDTEGLRARVEAALPADTRPPTELPKLEPRAGARYVVRCVYERPQCELVPHVVSRPSEPFQIAPFFDPDAPVRPVKIPLPTDVSVGGMRKFKKGVTFMISKSLNEKISQISGKERKLLSDDPELNAASSLDFAFVCSFSIQIIFIVAFFLLLMFVIILNLVFWWIAFFKICLPVPKSLLPE
jgi:hypothetical protein